MEVAKLSVAGADITVSDLKTITSGMVGATVTVEYDNFWNELNKQLVFRTVFGTVNAEGTVIPPETLKTADVELLVGVYGYTADGSLAIPTVWASLGKIKSGADPEGDESANPTLPVWAQIQNQIGSLDELSTEAKESLVAAVNELAAKGVDAEKINEIIVAYLEENEVAGKADWAVNDPAAAGYVENRTHWKEIREEILLDNVTITPDGYYVDDGSIILIPGETYRFTLDGIVYERVCSAYTVSVGDEAGTILGFGNLSALGMPVETNADPFAVVLAPGNEMIFFTVDGLNHVASMSRVFVEYHPIESAYLPAGIADIAEGLDQTVIPEEVLFEGYCTYFPTLAEGRLELNESYIVNVNGQSYVGVCQTVKDNVVCGNAALIYSECDDTGEPFALMCPNDATLFMYTLPAGAANYCRIIKARKVVTKIPAKYLPTHLEFPAVTAADAGKTLQWVVDESGNWVPQIVEGAT